MRNLPPLKLERLDQYVVRQLPTLSRGHAAQLIERGDVSANGKSQLKPGYKVRPGDDIKITYDQTKQPKIPQINLKILYEDNDCVVISKPVGLLTHSKGAFNPEATVASWLSHKIEPRAFRSLESEEDNTNEESETTNDRDGIVHRLDRATSGVMICAKTPEALSWLQKQFSERKVKKSYVAVASGLFKERVAVIDMPIERNPKKPQTFRVGSNGKSAVTAYSIIKTSEKLSLLELRPTTGRTHQLRVHLQHLGQPIVGDTMYGGKSADRLYLHAKSLELTLPNKQRKTFEVPVPAEFEELLLSP